MTRPTKWVETAWEVVTAIELNNKASKAAFDNRNALAADPTGNFNTISPCDLELWPMILAFKPDLRGVKLNVCARYINQKSSSAKLLSAHS